MTIKMIINLYRNEEYYKNKYAKRSEDCKSKPLKPEENLKKDSQVNYTSAQIAEE
ncbi:MAG: hypothetical protein WCG95_00190 [bacterium]